LSNICICFVSALPASPANALAASHGGAGRSAVFESIFLSPNPLAKVDRNCCRTEAIGHVERVAFVVVGVSSSVIGTPCSFSSRKESPDSHFGKDLKSGDSFDDRILSLILGK
jgi:hypothetical protein